MVTRVKRAGVHGCYGPRFFEVEYLAMKPPDAERFWREELLLAMGSCEKSMATRGTVPDLTRLPMRRFRSSLVYVAGFLLALSVSYFAVLASFVVLNRFLHIGGG